MVVDALAREPEPAGEPGGGIGFLQMGEEFLANGVQERGRGLGMPDDFERGRVPWDRTWHRQLFLSRCNILSVTGFRSPANPRNSAHTTITTPIPIFTAAAAARPSTAPQPARMAPSDHRDASTRTASRRRMLRRTRQPPTPRPERAGRRSRRSIHRSGRPNPPVSIPHSAARSGSRSRPRRAAQEQQKESTR